MLISRSRRVGFGALLLLIVASLPLGAQPERRLPGPVEVRTDTTRDRRAWDVQIQRYLRDGTLRRRQVREDTLIPGREIERLDQYVGEVRVVGADVCRQSENGATISALGRLFHDIQIDTEPALTGEDAARRIEGLSGEALGPSRRPDLVILPMPDGTFRLTWQARVMTETGLTRYFIDARTGAVVKQLSDLKTSVGQGLGVLGDLKKISTQQTAGAFLAVDELRPPAIRTYDAHGDLRKVIDFLNGVRNFTTSDVATDTDNDWQDGAAVDAHVYAGWFYDYLFKRFGRRGLDNRDLGIRSVVHPVLRKDLFTYSNEVIELFFLNAFYAGDGTMVYGEGLPPSLLLGGQSWNYLAGAIDVVGHELTHGVTDYSSQFIYEGESGALSEATSDVVATGAEFFFQEAGSGPLKADYLVGEDVVTPGGIRSLSNPALFGDPDHYSRRYRGAEDNGGVHINSTIASHAFYLAIEGGTNRTSGLSVQGVGPGSREQIEKVFYRAFTMLLPSNATFSMARAACVQSARDLYGTGSAPERAVTQAWAAVGVQ